MEPDQIDLMSAEELQRELRGMIERANTLRALSVANEKCAEATSDESAKRYSEGVANAYRSAANLILSNQSDSGA